MDGQVTAKILTSKCKVVEFCNFGPEILILSQICIRSDSGLLPSKTHRLNTAFCTNQPEKHGF